MTNPARAVDNGDTSATPASRAVDGLGCSGPNPSTSPNVLRTPRSGTLTLNVVGDDEVRGELRVCARRGVSHPCMRRVKDPNHDALRAILDGSCARRLYSI